MVVRRENFFQARRVLCEAFHEWGRGLVAGKNGGELSLDSENNKGVKERERGTLGRRSRLNHDHQLKVGKFFHNPSSS